MTRIGVTGHMNLTADSVSLVAQALRAALSAHAEAGLVGVSCLARGADSIFARVVLDLGGQLEVILPTANYRQTKVRPADAPTFDDLLRQATKVTIMSQAKADRHAYEAANNTLLASCDKLLAVWDGHSPADMGGTTAVVERAHSQGTPVEVIWPEGAKRER